MDDHTPKDEHRAFTLLTIRRHSSKPLFSTSRSCKFSSSRRLSTFLARYTHVHNLNVLYVDYDGGIVGAAINDAYTTLQGRDFPTLEQRTVAQFPTPDDIEREVCSTRYWAAIYTEPRATARLETALTGGSASADYNRSDVMTYIWNEARYSAIVDSQISATLQSLSSAARLAYTKSNGTGALQLLPSDDPAALSVLANPWQLTSVNIQPTTQGSRLIYNTLVIILIMIQEFFYLSTVNGLYIQFKVYGRLFPLRIIAYRNIISLAYTCVRALSSTRAIWAFRADWHVNGNQFVLTWMILWLFAHANFLSLDMFSVLLPPPYVPMALISWIVLNVTLILAPFELSPCFYKWAYVMPAHQTYQVLADIWSRGCNPQLHYALPILFALEVSGIILSGLGVYRRCHYAMIAEKAQDVAVREKLDAAISFERQRDANRGAEREAQGREVREPENKSDLEQAESTERNELADVVRENHEIRRGKSRRGTTLNFGPTFDLPFQESET